MWANKDVCTFCEIASQIYFIKFIIIFKETINVKQNYLYFIYAIVLIE